MGVKLRTWLICVATLMYLKGISQLQSCPMNINFAQKDLSQWSAKTGLLGSSTLNYPAPNTGKTIIPEFSLSSAGIKVIKTASQDIYGGFPTVPVINGYSYGYSVQIGSTNTSWDLHSSSPNPGGFVRSISYLINVPAGPATVPYTMTYAYAMVLENGTHNSVNQPLFKATLSVDDAIIQCASPHYFLPTLDNADPDGGGIGTGATLDSAAAIANGFTNSPVLFLSHAGQAGNNGTLLRDVWTKGWTEVTFDLSPYRGQQVTLTFEADNCLPGAHFAYAYVALRNTCAGLEISGNPVACTNTKATYSVPALAGATYTWHVPSDWVINSGSNTNIITVTPGTSSGFITINEKNSCADLDDTMAVTTTPPTVPGAVLTNNTVCAGNNSTSLNLNGATGNVLNWISSTDGGNHWTPLPVTGGSFTAQDLLTTTIYRAVVQNGAACAIDTSAAATVTVDPKSVGGDLLPASMNFCIGQNTNTTLSLGGNTGNVVTWQRSMDSVNWADLVPPNTTSSFAVSNVTANQYYRTIVKSGVCPNDTSRVAAIHFINVPFPVAAIDPDSAYICYGTSIPLNATITTGTSYSWSNTNTLANTGSGVVTSIPLSLQATATPRTSTNYVLTVNNAGCPNPLQDTFHIGVAPQIIVDAGNDTAIVTNQPLQLHTNVSDPGANQFLWRPATGLNSTTRPDPIAQFIPEQSGGTITYIVRATNQQGCFGEDTITVKIFTTGPDIFVPSGFTPNGDGRNDVLRPICVGISRLNYFRVFNRWGQLVFSTSQIGAGWDGRISGQPQATGNFVYIAQGIDYTGKIVFKKGNITLLR